MHKLNFTTHPSPDAGFPAEGSVLTREQTTPPPRIETMMDAFVACRLTLDDLQQRTAALGRNLTICDIASHLTGKIQFADPAHNVLAEAINRRLAELAQRSRVPYRG